MKITETPLSGLRWEKSSYSGPNGNCVETAPHQIPGALPIRDSKKPAGPALIAGTDAWTAFLSGVRSNRLL